LLLFLRRWLGPRLRKGGEVLEIGPSRPAPRLLARRDTIGRARYTAIDLDRRPHHRHLRPPHRFRRMDATRMGFPAGMFDVILCNNVLPFVQDDSAVLAEIRRCLKPDGVAMVDVSVEIPRTTSVARLRETGHFTSAYLATHGTHRFYGHDYPRRLRAAGLTPLRFDPLAGLSLRFRRAHGLKSDGSVYLAFRTPAAARRFARAIPAT
jgi:SAM-dependent methyltransferase